MITDIMTAFKQRIRERDWLDEQTKQAVIDKVPILLIIEWLVVH